MQKPKKVQKQFFFQQWARTAPRTRTGGTPRRRQKLTNSAMPDTPRSFWTGSSPTATSRIDALQVIMPCRKWAKERKAMGILKDFKDCRFFVFYFVLFRENLLFRKLIFKGLPEGSPSPTPHSPGKKCRYRRIENWSAGVSANIECSQVQQRKAHFPSSKQEKVHFASTRKH